MIRIALLIALLPIVVQSKAQRNDFFCLMGSARQSYDKKITNESVYPEAVCDKPGQPVNFKLARFLTGLFESTKDHKSDREEFYKSLPNLKRVPALINHDSISAAALESTLIITCYSLPAMNGKQNVAGIRNAYKLTHEIFNAVKQANRQKYTADMVKYQLAVNRIDDKTSPALLYAIALAKTIRIKNNTEKDDLERHPEYSMELLRILSHDHLESDEQHAVSELNSVTDNGLYMLSSTLKFHFIFQEKSDRNQFISNYQFIRLKSILQECISNSIKHAQFEYINISFPQSGNKLTTRYNDNGKG